ncbi:hypothetical protein M413DRAFT_31326 [Hebeloma cylindrosporum]|uniref:Nephrocystin 3-like N-terminal domain-containing protein n=1 Tax=Hebeloma cylindrosporum TaxID=76867 RepID=A0A0C2Y7C4_HEBCY|nr:hypothetical protein M413DRAFT_31326 [Hebeloma cylindrosporum h7]
MPSPNQEDDFETDPLIEDGRMRKLFILWMYGPAGSGKSAISKTIAEMCANAGLLAASFFFSRTAPGRNAKTFLKPTLAYQLSLSIPAMRDHLADSIAHDPTIFSQSLLPQITRLIIEPLNGVVSKPDNFEIHATKCIVLDGLDECLNEEAQVEILDAIARCASSCSFPLLFLVASRPEYAIREAFNGEALRLITDSLPLDDTYEASDDIRLFMTSCFENIKQTHPAKHRLHQSWPASDDLNVLITRASGQFIYASTVMKFVESRHHIPYKRLDIVLGVSPSDDSTPFAQLDAMYRHIFSRISNLQPTLELISFIILQGQTKWGTFPVTVQFSEIFFGYDQGFSDIILSELHAILFVPAPGKSNAEIHLHHQSLGDFLLDQSRSRDFWIGSGQTRATLATHWVGFSPRSTRHEYEFYIALPNILMNCSKASPTAELVTALNTWDLCAALTCGGYPIDTFALLPDFFDWLQREFREPSQRLVFDRLLNDFDRYICRMTSCSQDTRLYLQSILTEGGAFEQKGMELLLILNGYPKRASHEYDLVGQCISFDFRKMVANIFSKPGRASNYSVDGTVYAGLIRRFAEFLSEPDPQWEEREEAHENYHAVFRMRESALQLITGILPKAEIVPQLAEYLRDAVFPPTSLKEPFQRALEDYIIRCNVLLDPSTDLTHS